MKSKLLLFFFPLQLLFFSCRQEIVSPDNPAGNINEPQLTRTNFSYTFTINANKITETIADNTYLNTLRSRISMIINDHSSGSVEVIVKSNQNNIVYSELLDGDTNILSNEIEGQQPSVIIFNFINFTGKFKVTLTAID